MLNLVQLQERLKGVPIQALMQYANGANPQVPPFLALGELNRRKKMQEGAAAEQAQEMEGSTVKQQIEQAAGLMALQGNRQRQAAQQQAGIQAAMPMAAPNTTTSEPAQLAGGGFIDDIVVPRDYQAGGDVFNPEDLKRIMLREAMQGDVADIPKELTSAVARAALRRRPGVAGIPLPANLFKRSDYAGGGIVAFAGPQGSFVERSPGFYQLEEELPEDEERAAMLAQLPPAVREMLRVAERQKQAMSPEAVRDRRKAAGLPTLVSELPDTSAKTLAELQRQKREFDESDTIFNRFLALTPGRRFGTGETGRGIVSYEKERAAKSGELGKAIASAEDLKEKAKLDFMEGRFREGETALAAANKIESEMIAKIPDALQKDALAQQALAGRTSNLREMYKTELAGLVAEGKDPNDPRVQREANRRAAYYVATLAGPRVEATERGTEAANERAAIDKYSELFDPRKLLYGPLSDDMDAAAARDKKEKTGNKYQNEIRLREYNRIREGLSLPPVSSLPGSAPTGGSTRGSAPPPPPGFVVPPKK
jgi:hypothetical protein